MVANELRGASFSCPVGDSAVGQNLPVDALPIFVGGSNSSVWPPPPYGSGDFSEHCQPLFGNFTDLHSEDCWRFYCPIMTGEFILDVYKMPTTAGDALGSLMVCLVYFVGLRVLTLIAEGCIQHVKR